MKAFHTVAVPHADILEGKLTMDVFAADLWEVSRNRGSEEYRDADTFFRKTYLTQGLENLMDIVEKRIKGEGGDPVLQIQTPFGGGKTHALIAMYHKARSWGANRVVISGTALGGEHTLWGLMEKQLTGKNAEFSGMSWKGKEGIMELLSHAQPVLILMDEILEYATKAAAVRVEATNLAALTIAFIKDLTEAVANLDRGCLLITLPSSIIEHYDEQAERLYQQLQKVSGRVEKIYTPVQDNEVVKVIRRRLFSSVSQSAMKKVINEFMEFAEKEGLIPAEVEPSEYRDRFIDSYPFMPEVVDVLYHRWGSFPSFQRTRGVLRLLSLVVHSLKETTKPYIGLGDIDLSNQEIRQEFIKHIGAEYNAVIAADITSSGSGAKKVDKSLGNAYKGLGLGTRTATTVFLYSFSGGTEKGATVAEIKRSATTMENPASVVAEAVEQLKGKLFYLQSIGEKYYFSNQPNLNRIRLGKMENIKDEQVRDVERELLKGTLGGSKLRIFLWEEDSANIPDTEEHKLLVLKQKDSEVMKQILENKGSTPRIYRNTIFFLYPVEGERAAFTNAAKMKLACEAIANDKTIALSKDQKKENDKELKKAESNLLEAIRRLYRMVSVPGKDGFKEIDLGIPTYGETKSLHEEVYEKLKLDGEILEIIAPLVLKEKYLVGKDYVLTEQLCQALFRTPGETRPVNRAVLEESIKEGVRRGLFGLGELGEGKLTVRYFEKTPSVSFVDPEILIAENLCKEWEAQKEPEKKSISEGTPEPVERYEKPRPQAVDVKPSPEEEVKKELKLSFTVPKGKVSNIMGLMNFLQKKFDILEIRLVAREGSITPQEYEDKVEETFRQLGIEVREDGEG